MGPWAAARPEKHPDRQDRNHLMWRLQLHDLLAQAQDHTRTQSPSPGLVTMVDRMEPEEPSPIDEPLFGSEPLLHQRLRLRFLCQRMVRPAGQRQGRPKGGLRYFRAYP